MEDEESVVDFAAYWEATTVEETERCFVEDVGTYSDAVLDFVEDLQATVGALVGAAVNVAAVVVGCCLQVVTVVEEAKP